MGRALSNGIITKAVMGALITALVLKFFVLDFMVAEGQSMAPALRPGSMLLVCRVYYGFKLPWSQSYILQWKAPQGGDVVVFYTPLGEIAVKRIGDMIPGAMFIALGDNLDQSYDSRNYGPVPVQNIIGKVMGITR
ncbi:MAG: S26 family signal peptidase [Treponema sp.]|nr:S26 family signal peptidase [Treponema sp.]